MTGFAMVKRDTASGELTISLRSVNHRGLDLHFHHSADLSPFENAMRTILKQNIGRGHVELRAFVTRSDSDRAGSYNHELVNRFIDAHQRAAREHQLTSKPDLNFALTLPGVFNGDAVAKFLDKSFEPEVLAAMTDCVRQLNACRDREGQELEKQLREEVSAIERNTAEIVRIRRGALPEIRDRLQSRLAELLGTTPISESRLIEEASILADRSDIQEELTRLKVHAGELRRLLQAGGEVGKRLDFLLQELNRETNTVLSKTSGAGETGLEVTNLALNLKAHIEKIREQALNLE
ncbi:MAG: hypothetical protein JWP08_645 [Bryobacterales bacterium]|jgi:uncharacterized protein (TIGR00255 family)|nr:hypothetical protein [Bryobacterales bacterium]